MKKPPNSSHCHQKKRSVNHNHSNNNHNHSSNGLGGFNDIYNINNFCSNTVKIREKNYRHLVQCPTFEELPDEFFEDNNIQVILCYLLFIIIYFIGL